MKTEQIPEWWKDVARAESEALSDYEHLLQLLETDLKKTPDYSSRSLTASIKKWTILVKAVEDAGLRIASVQRLAATRRHDAVNTGHLLEYHSGSEQKLHLALGKSRNLQSEIRRRMTQLAREMASRPPRRPGRRGYSSPSPSHVDICV